MKNILIPTDFSENSWNAIKYGMELFKKTKCIFHIIHINPVTSYSGGEAAMYVSPEMLEETFLKESNLKLQQLLEDIEQLPFNTKHTFYTASFYGFFTDHIIHEVKEKTIDLIIMGTKGASGLKAVSIGSNTGNVITKVKCALLAIPENAVYQRPKEIGFPTDFKINYNLKVLEQIKDLALLHNSFIRFLYVALNDENLDQQQSLNKKVLENYFEAIEYNFHKISGEKLETAIRCFSESRELDMLVMVTKNLNFIERFFIRPTVEKISYQTTIPLFVIHEL
jgi:nucleotide-binding universal stress UspA family protein